MGMRWGLIALAAVAFGAGAGVGGWVGTWHTVPDPLLRAALWHELVSTRGSCEPGTATDPPRNLAPLPCLAVAARTIEPGTILGPADVRGALLPPEYIASTIVADPRGRTTTRRLYVGELFDQYSLAEEAP